jgi:protease PrsW
MSATVDAPARQAQLAAIEHSGVAERFHLLQLRNPALWVLVWGVVAGAIRMVTFYQPGTTNYGGALAAGSATFAIYTVAWLLFLHWIDRYTPMRPGLLATGFLWGAFAGTFFLALTVNTALLSLYAKWFGPTWGNDWAAGATAPITEETAKALGFVLLLGLAPRLIRSAFDAFVLGAFIGLGFEVSEDVLYVFQGATAHFGTHQVTDSAQVIAVRSASGVTSHALFSALVCCGLMWILGRDPRGRRVGKGLLLIVTAMALHGAWDVSGSLGTSIGGPVLGGAMTPILVVVGITVVLFVSRDAAATDRGWARAILEPEVERGTLSATEAHAIAGTHKDRRHFVKAAHGHPSRRVAKHIVTAGRELLEAIGRSGGDDDEAVEHARREVARLRTA